LIETDSKPRLASSFFSACSLMRGIGQPRTGPRIPLRIIQAPSVCPQW
jgi:hypothetical protein